MNQVELVTNTVPGGGGQGEGGSCVGVHRKVAGEAQGKGHDKEQRKGKGEREEMRVGTLHV